MDEYLSKVHQDELKCKQPHPGYEPWSLIPFPLTVTFR